VEPRHASRLLDTRDMSDHTFIELADLLEPGDLVVVNETRVRACRLLGRRAGTGGKVELFLLGRRPNGLWNAIARPGRRLRAGVELEFDDLTATVVDKGEGILVVSLDADDEEAAIDAAGMVPLPPYFMGELDDDERYQTMFADQVGSAAAPTAGLHFTPEVVERLATRDIAMATVDLHVSLDTFRPITVSDISDHQMHSEWCTVSPETAQAVAKARRVVAVGTTVVRTLESFAVADHTLEPGEKDTDLFLKPGSHFQVVDGLVTNFHMPGSTLLVLLAAFMGDRWRDAYATALDRGYRFLSFGDAMYAERSQA
jgi:S-adenosylmethionine:tRNA ribosyltransferase-isomerase